MNLATTLSLFCGGPSVHRSVNLNTVDDPEIYEVHDAKGKTLARFRDSAGAEEFARQYQRKSLGMRKEPKIVRVAREQRDGVREALDNRQRNTTGGTGGTGGPGNG